jgi:phage regulator Rha-like protein
MAELIHVQSVDDTFVMDSRDIAKGLGIDHSNFLETIKKHQTTIERDFERVPFQTETLETKGGKQSVKFALLSDEQAAYIITLSRNTPKVIEFKSLLVRSFSSARKQLPSIHQSSPLSIEPQTPIYSQDIDSLLSDYMNRHIDQVKLVKSIGDLEKLENNLADFIKEYKAIEQEERAAKERKDKLRASISSGSTSNPSRVTLPPAKQSNSSTKERETLAALLDDYTSSIRDKRNTEHTRKPKGKANQGRLLICFQELCKQSGVVYTDEAIESILQSLGWKRDSRSANRWIIFY